MARQNYSSGTPWERIAGYSRAVRVGNLVYVAGTTASDEEGNLYGCDDPYAQAAYILRKIRQSLEQVGASIEDVVRTRVYLANVDHWEPVARAHGEVFEKIRPVNTLFAVGALVAGRLVEIDADAVVEGERAV